jgi:hypothetical protein
MMNAVSGKMVVVGVAHRNFEQHFLGFYAKPAELVASTKLPQATTVRHPKRFFTKDRETLKSLDS